MFKEISVLIVIIFSNNTERRRVCLRQPRFFSFTLHFLEMENTVRSAEVMAISLRCAAAAVNTAQ